MKNFEDFVRGINGEIEVPAKINQRFDETLRSLEPTERKDGYRWLKTASVAAAFVVVCGAFLASNLTFASELPLIGTIFDKVQDDVIYSGDYSNKKTLDQDVGEQAVSYAEDQGIVLRASEVYSDGYSVFATLKMESDQFDFSKVEVTQNGVQAINLDTRYGLNREPEVYDYEILLDGRNEGNNAFIGMMKFDKAEPSWEDGYVNIEVKNISVFGEDGEEESREGSWKLRIPYETDRENSREIPVNQEMQNGLKLEKLFVSPYQLVLLSDLQGKQRYEELYYEYAVFDQDGMPLAFQEIGNLMGELESDIFSLGGRELSQIHIYVSQDDKNMNKLRQAKTEKEAKKLSQEDYVIAVN